MSREALQPAWVLHRRPYRESSVLLELFTLDYGRVGLVARGARAARSRTQGLLQPFQPLLVSWSRRGELGTLTAVERGGAAPRLPAGRLMAGFYLNELLLKLLQRHDAQGTLFDSYAQATVALAQAADDQAVAAALRLFEKRLLEALGYGLNLTHEALTGQPVRADALYHYHAESGPVPAGVSDGTRHVVSGGALQALAAERLESPAHLRELKPLLREAIATQLGGRRLQTSDVARALAR